MMASPTGENSMLLGVIADDFTGASDVANALAKSGMSTVLHIGVPDTNLGADAAACVVALKSRSIAADAAVRQSLQACAWLLEQGCRQILFKYCSTFDSTPAGNIGPVAEALLDRLGAETAIVCPVFPATGRTLYEGHLFVSGKLLNESGLEHHPLNPMTDANILRWLRRQTKSEVGLVRLGDVRRGEAAIRERLAAEAASGRRLVVVDAIDDADLYAIGAAVRDQRLVTGGSGIALALPENFRRAGHDVAASAAFSGRSGPACVLSGSCSLALRGQVEAFSAKHPALFVDPDRLVARQMDSVKASHWMLERIDAAPMIYTSSDPADVAAAQARHGREPLAAAIETFFGDLSVRLADAGVCRLVIGGGETSGAVVSALGSRAFAIGREIDPGVPALAEIGGRNLRLALKSGNFGAVDFFDKALRHLAGDAS
jgi:3-dehydrotetronate 4-kinase